MGKSNPPWMKSLYLGLGVLATTLASLVLWNVLRKPVKSRLLTLGGDDDEEEVTVTKKIDGVAKTPRGSPPAQESTTPLQSNVSRDGQQIETKKKAAGKKPTGGADDAEKALHQKIEEIDRRGKVLFKEKKYMEAAETFTEALDLIEREHPDSAEIESTPASLVRQIITLTNNRSAMYEKGSMPDLALHDCDAILSRDPGHAKARTRRLRILESQKRHADALVEVCALQLQFMQQNRDKIRMGIPVTPPVKQSKIEELMVAILPDEVERRVKQAKEVSVTDRPLPSHHTILQLLKSFSGYNTWMSAAARGGSVESLTSELDAVTGDGVHDIAKRASLLLKRGRRHAYDRKFDLAVKDFDAAYELAGGEKQNDEKADAVRDALEEGEYARLLEWVGMARHLRYDLDMALKCYEKCSDLEPTNVEILVKRAGVKMDAGKHDDAISLFDTALGLDPNAPDALLHRANLRMMQSKSSEAKADLERCLRLFPDNILARLRLATVLMATEDLEGARKCLDQAEEYEPESSEVHSYRGEMHFAQGEFKEARVEFERAMQCETGNPTPYVNSALAVMNAPPEGGGMPDFAEAIRLLEKAVKVDPQFHAAYVHLGQLKLSMATDLTKAREVIALYDRGLQYCRTPEELKDICSMRLLTIAQVDAASSLKMETLNMQ